MNSQSSSPIQMKPNLPTTTPPRSTTPSDLFWQIQTIRTKRMMGPIFDDSILPSYWSTKMKKALAIHIEDAITIKEMLTTTIRDVKYYLLTSTAPPADQLALIMSLIKMMEKFEEAKLLIDRFTKYLCIIREATGHRSFNHLRTTSEVSERITQYARSTGTVITSNDNE